LLAKVNPLFAFQSLDGFAGGAHSVIRAVPPYFFLGGGGG